jgi:hypothetical protein
MKQSHDDSSPTPRDEPAPKTRPAWVRPRLVEYGPISKLTQGGSGGKADVGTTKKH